MANITFTSPSMGKDVTVYAVAGDRGTILSLAQENNIPIPFDCQDGECGSCIIEVDILEQDTKYRKYGATLGEREKELLRQLGKLSKEEIYEAEVNDLPPRTRLACQYIVRNEDILVHFEGDETLPKQEPATTPAAKIFKGGLRINALDEFLSYAVKVEEDAAIHFDSLGAKMEECGNDAVAKLFKQLASFSRLHLAEAKERAAAVTDDIIIPPDYVWPDHATPERTSLMAGDPGMTRLDALKAALQGEKRGYEFYVSVKAKTDDEEVRDMAHTFVHEEAEHVKILEAWIAQEEWNSKHAETV